MSRNEYVAKLVRENADEWVRDPTWPMKKDSFQAMSAQKWAVDKAIEAILTSEDTPAEAVADLTQKVVGHPSGDWMAIVAADVLEDIYYYICDIA